MILAIERVACLDINFLLHTKAKRALAVFNPKLVNNFQVLARELLNI